MRTANGWPLKPDEKQKEQQEVEMIKKDFLGRLHKFRSQQEQLLDPQVHARLLALEAGVRSGQQVCLQDLWIVGHVLEMRIRCAMGRLLHCEIKNSAVQNEVPIHVDGIYGPLDKPIGLRVYHSVSFDNDACRIPQFDWMFPDAAGCTLLSHEADVEQEPGPSVFQQDAVEEVFALSSVPRPQTSVSQPSDSTTDASKGWTLSRKGLYNKVNRIVEIVCVNFVCYVFEYVCLYTHCVGHNCILYAYNGIQLHDGAKQ